MPLYRGLFGKGSPPPAEDPTRRIVRPGTDQADGKASSTPDSAPATEGHDGAAKPAAASVGATRLIMRSKPAPALKPPTESASRPATNPPAPAPTAVAIRDPLANPIIGWLAVVAGPGLGEILPLGYGVNDIGRGADVRVQLNFGDETITGGDPAISIYAAIIYTARTRRFYLQAVAAETWLDERAVSGSMELTGGETLRLGQTHLRFVPLCGPDFDWRAGG
ncbi:MAG: FHA domain-containing protein [Candidatus Competibacteraceae bacterium]